MLTHTNFIKVIHHDKAGMRVSLILPWPENNTFHFFILFFYLVASFSGLYCSITQPISNDLIYFMSE